MSKHVAAAVFHLLALIASLKVGVGQELEMFQDRQISIFSSNDDERIRFSDWANVWSIKNVKERIEDRSPVRVLPHYFGFISQKDDLDFDFWAKNQMQISREFLPAFESRMQTFLDRDNFAVASRIESCLCEIAVRDDVPKLIRTAAILVHTAISHTEIQDSCVFLYLLIHDSTDFVNHVELSNLAKDLSLMIPIRSYANITEANAILRREDLFSEHNIFDPTVVDSLRLIRSGKFAIPFSLETGRETKSFNPSLHFDSETKGIKNHARLMETNEFEILEDFRSNEMSTIPRELRRRFIEKTLVGFRLFLENTAPSKQRAAYAIIQKDAELAVARALRCDSIEDVFTARAIYKSMVRSCGIEEDDALASSEWYQMEQLLKDFPHREGYRFGRRTINFDSLLKAINTIASGWEDRLLQSWIVESERK